MTVRARDSTVSQIGAVRVRVDETTLATIGAFRVRDASGLYSVLDALKATASPDYADGFGYSLHPISITTNPVTVSVVGAIGDVTHAWTFADAGWTATAPSGATTAFRTPVGPSDTSSTTATDTVTDASGATTTASLPATCTNNSPGA